MAGPVSREDLLRKYGRFGANKFALSDLIDHFIDRRKKMIFLPTVPVGPVASGTEVTFTLQIADANSDPIHFLDKAESLSVTFVLDGGSLAGTIVTPQPVSFVQKRVGTLLLLEAVCKAMPDVAGPGSLILGLTDTGATGLDVTALGSVVVS